MLYDRWIRSLTIAGLTLAISACGNTLDRLSTVGKEPPLAKIENPQERRDYEPVSWPAPEPKVGHERGTNSLWQPGSRAFFRDQRARDVGDILTVKVEINDSAKLDNSTERERESEEDMQFPSLWGLQNRVAGLLMEEGEDPTDIFDVSSTTSTTGEGTINRRESIETEVAALVTQVLPNGNLVISGRQEVRVNFEVRQLQVDGVIRPEDINSDNTIELADIAEARVAYGGRGQISDLQQPRVGTQIIDILSPF